MISPFFNRLSGIKFPNKTNPLIEDLRFLTLAWSHAAWDDWIMAIPKYGMIELLTLNNVCIYIYIFDHGTCRTMDENILNILGILVPFEIF